MTTKLTQAEKMKRRVLIAKDALKWLRVGALKAKKRVYVELVETERRHQLADRTDLKEVQARDVLFGQCNVCAKGAMFIAHAVRYDNVTADKVLNVAPHYVCDSLTEEFDPSTLNKVEAAFEGWANWTYGWDFYKFYTDNPDDTKRLELVLKNIIKNKGDFDTEKYPLV